jgi:hypothetical protein
MFRAIISSILKITRLCLCTDDAVSLHYTTSCKHNLVLPRMGEIIARNMSSWLKLLIKLLFLQLGVYIIVSVMHGHTNIEKSHSSSLTRFSFFPYTPTPFPSLSLLLKLLFHQWAGTEIPKSMTPFSPIIQMYTGAANVGCHLVSF